VFDGTVYSHRAAHATVGQDHAIDLRRAEPGVIFIDRINQRNNLAAIAKPSPTNPCGEQPLPPYGACLLGSINLARLVRVSVRAPPGVDRRRWRKRCRRGPHDGQRRRRVELSAGAGSAEAQAKRRIGLGVTGLADALLMCGLRYGSDPRRRRRRRAWMAADRARRLSRLARAGAEKGPFPLFDSDAYLAQAVTSPRLDEDLRAAIAEHGVRNALVTSIAPTGTISLFAGNVSSGVEPVFALKPTPQGAAAGRKPQVEEVERLRLAPVRARGEDAELPRLFVDAQILAPHDHLCACRPPCRHMSTARSPRPSTCPEDIGFEAFKCLPKPTTPAARAAPPTGPTPSRARCCRRRARPQRGAGGSPRKPTRRITPATSSTCAEPLDRPNALPGFTYKLKWGDSDHAIYITMNDIVEDGAAGRSRSSSTPRTWSTMPGPSR
jgi:ribonucleoside-diphosphate reductase alpha chain